MAARKGVVANSLYFNDICSMRPLPEAFIERIKDQYPNDHSVFLQALDQPSFTSVHIHSKKGLKLFQHEERVPWWENGRVLKERPKFTYDPRFHGGAYYPQESSSMFIGFLAKEILKGKQNLRVLDLCAAPGGKSILLSEVIGERGVLISNEVNKTRAKILEENLVKWGARNVMVSSNEVTQFSALKNYFDLILVDAPCSGEGMFRKDDRAREEWSLSNVEMCATRQRDILQHLPDLLKEGGTLIYSTCTFATEENESQTEFLIKEHGLVESRPAIPEEWKTFVAVDQGFKFLPHKAIGEGFYCNVFKKASATEGRLHIRKSQHSWYRKATSKELEVLKWRPEPFVFINKNNVLFSVPVDEDELAFLLQSLYITLPGVELGEIIKGELIPAHALAMQPNVHSVYPIFELSEMDAIRYLMKEDIQIQTPTLGWALVAYDGVQLGFVKLLKHRVNNYYPKEWKIRYRES